MSTDIYSGLHNTRALDGNFVLSCHKPDYRALDEGIEAVTSAASELSPTIAAARPL